MKTHYLRQPNNGRIVEVANEESLRDLIDFRKFTIPTDQEVEEYLQERAVRVGGYKNEGAKYKLDVYFKTVEKRGDGYGMSMYNIAQEMKKLGIFLNPQYKGQKIGLLYHRPEGLMRMQNDVRVVYTMFESSKTPRAVRSKEDPDPQPIWNQFLELADRVIVPSKFVSDVFAKDGIATDVIPLGYNSDVFTYQPRTETTEERKDFTFLHYNAFNARKGFIEVWAAFNKAFKNNEPVKLILKTTLQQMPIPISKKQYPNVEVILGDVPESELLNIMKRSHCFVYPSRGEGFGITPLEAMATGLPAIVPNAHGISEYFDKHYMYEAKVSEKCPGIYHAFKGMDTGEMVVCDVDALARQMRYIYTHQRQALEKGRQAAEYVKKFSYASTAKKLADLLFELDKNPTKKRTDTDQLLTEEI